LRARPGETTFLGVHKKRHKSWPELKRAREAAEGAALYGEPAAHDLSVFFPFDTPGISLTGLRQSTAHKAIRRAAELNAAPRRQTQENLDQVRSSMERLCGYRPTDEHIWNGLRSRDLSRNVRNFMWKALHGAHKIGKYFEKMPEPWRSMKDCPLCGTTETLEHIIFTCASPARQLIWDLA
ncbi:hypothetical protein AURDEDRAFT_25479, partial [Auricularia subglabra TFB-10046 SS5]